MSDISIDALLGTLENLTTRSNLEKKQLQSFAEDIMYLRGFLIKITEKKHNEHPQGMDLVMRIRDIVSKTKNNVEQYEALVSKVNDSPLEGYVHVSPDFESLKKEIKTLKAEVEHILGENMQTGVAGEKLEHPSTGSEGSLNSSRERNTYKVGEEKVVVGFEGEVNALLGKLRDSADRQLEIISIIGAGGGGKTTLAREVYAHPSTLYMFEIRAWVNVSQNYNETMKKDILISIMKSAFPEYQDNYQTMSEDNLGEKVKRCLKGKKYLIVMDDIWDPKAWNDIQTSFPRACDNSKDCKVLFTSRLPVKPVGIRSVRHDVGLLSTSCSWELLQKKVFKGKQCPQDLVGIGTQIAEKCKGLPLAIITIAGILANKDETDNVWEQVAKNLTSIIATNNEAYMEILELSYNHLPFHLKVCFLYSGANLEDKEISVRRLIWLWIAEGFIQQNGGGKSLEAEAKDYLTSLIERNLVMVARKGSLRAIKACNIHDLLRQLCLKKAKEEKNLEQIYENESSSPSATNEHRGLFIDTPFFNKFSSSPCAQNLRSFPCSSLPNKAIVAEGSLSFSAEKFELLRVLHLNSGTIGQLRSGDLVLLRYLEISLPTEQHHLAANFFGNLLNLEILNFKVGWDNILLPHDIFKMVKLRHLYTQRGTFTCHHDSHVEEEGNMLDSLQTLQRMGMCEHCLGFLKRTPNLTKLRLSGHLCSELNGDLMLPDLEFLESLEILSVSGRDKRAQVASTWLKLPLTLTKLTLKKTHLEWKKLSEILQTLGSLEALKLLSEACSGPIWDTSELDGEISQLKYLRLQLLDFKEWSVSEGQFPKLEVLVIQHCSELKEIPFEFAERYELHEITVEYCRPSAEESARKIQDELTYVNGKDGCPKLFTRGNDPKDCAICYEPYEDTTDVEILPCSHIFHSKCMGDWLKINACCPLCKSETGDLGNS